MKIAKETWIILLIGLADLVTTIVFIKHHGAQEANPLFRHYWDMGLSAFIAAKVALLLGPVYVLEWARKRNPRFVAWALRGTIAAYLLMYGVGFYKLNVHQAPHATPAEMADMELTYLPPEVIPPRMFNPTHNRIHTLHGTDLNRKVKISQNNITAF